MGVCFSAITLSKKLFFGLLSQVELVVLFYATLPFALFWIIATLGRCQMQILRRLFHEFDFLFSLVQIAGIYGSGVLIYPYFVEQVYIYSHNTQYTICSYLFLWRLFCRWLFFCWRVPSRCWSVLMLCPPTLDIGWFQR